MRLSRDAGLPDEAIAAAVTEGGTEDHREIRRKLTRLERPARASGSGGRDWRERQAAAYAVAALKGLWYPISRSPGWVQDPAGKALTAVQALAIADHLKLQIEAVRRCATARLFLVPLPADPDDYYQRVGEKVAALRMLARDARTVESSARRQLALGRLGGLDTGIYARRSASERRLIEAELGLDLPAERASSTDVLSRRTMSFEDALGDPSDR